MCSVKSNIKCFCKTPVSSSFILSLEYLMRLDGNPFFQQNMNIISPTYKLYNTRTSLKFSYNLQDVLVQMLVGKLPLIKGIKPLNWMHKKSGVKLNLSFSQQLSPLLSQTKQKSNKKKRCVVVVYHQSDIFNFIKPTTLISYTNIKFKWM
jgi:hypothetical protein